MSLRGRTPEIHALPETPPIYFSTLGIENVRCFGERQVLRLTDNGRPARWTLLIGENGTGKTTLLECLAWMRPEPDDSEVMTDSKGLGGLGPLSSGKLKPALAGEQNEVLETLPRNGSREVILDGNLSFGGVGLRPTSGPESDDSRAKDFRLGMQISFDGHAQLIDWEQLETPLIEALGGAFHDPLIVTYGANRYLGYRNSRGVDQLGPRPWDHERLSQGTELYDIEEILMGLDYAAKANRCAPEGPRLKLLKEAISRILPDDQDEETIEIHPPDLLETRRLSGVYVKTFTGTVPMSALSMGYRTTAGWLVDLAWRFFDHYPDSPNPFEEPAVVLIDEIDLHLHPRWQLEIMKDLSSLFPATQFIATSHSPLVVQVAETANLVLLRKQEDCVEIVNDPGVRKDLRVDQILTSLLFGLTSSRSEHIESLRVERAELLDKDERSQEEEDILSDIRRKLNELPTAEDPDDRDAMDLIRRFASHLEEKGSADP